MIMTLTSGANVSNAMEHQTDASKAAQQAYISINQNWSYPHNNTIPVDTTPSWERLTVNTNAGLTSMVMWNFEQQPSISEALDEIIKTNLCMECSNAARIVRLALISSIVGDQGMLQLVKDLQKRGLSGFNLMNQLSWQFFERTPGLGEGIYAFPFVNIPEYPMYKNGADANHNVIRLSDSKFIGFDPEFFTEPRTYDEVTEFLYTQFTDSKNLIPAQERNHKEFIQELTFNKFEESRVNYQNTVGYFVFNMLAAEKYAKTAKT